MNTLTRKSYTAEVYEADVSNQFSIDAIPEHYSSTDDEYSNQYELSQVANAIRQLPEILQDTMILYAAHGYTMKEIAEIQGCSIETVKKRVQRSRAKIRKILGADK